MNQSTRLLALAALSGCMPTLSPPPPPTQAAAPAAAPTVVIPVSEPEPAEPTPEPIEAPIPKSFVVEIHTTKGAFMIEARREWAPHGVDRFHELVKTGYYTDIAFFRVIPDFIVQFGIHGNPAVNSTFKNDRLPIDPVRMSNTRGTVTYAMAGKPDTRTVQLFINLKDNARLDKQGFAPIGEVVLGMEVVESLYAGYGEKASTKQSRIQTDGNQFLRTEFPNLDYLTEAKLIPAP